MEIAAVLRVVSSGKLDQRFSEVKQILETDWRAIAARKFPKLGDDFEDAMQDTWNTVLRPEKLGAVNDPSLIRRWARQVFVNKAYDMLRWRWPDDQQDLHDEQRDNDDLLRSRLPTRAPTPEEEASSRERLAAILELIGDNLAARLRALDDLPDREIALRVGLASRDAVAGQLKRFRTRLRLLLEQLDFDGARAVDPRARSAIEAPPRAARAKSGGPP